MHLLEIEPHGEFSSFFHNAVLDHAGGYVKLALIPHDQFQPEAARRFCFLSWVVIVDIPEIGRYKQLLKSSNVSLG
jgi:hypothetical protein